MTGVMLFDESSCIECQACSVRCKGEYGPKPAVFRTWVTARETGTYPAVRQGLYKSACMHCTSAPCVEVCPTGAMHKTPDGLTDVDKSMCIACNYCVANCPYMAVKFIHVDNAVDKCDFCRHLLARGMDPVCVRACPAGALSFGTKESMVAKAESILDRLRGRGFGNAHIYGLDQLDGQHVLYVLKSQPALYGLPEDPSVPMGARTWKLLTSPVGGVAAAALAVVLASDAIRQRKLRVQQEQSQDASKQ